MSRNQEILTAVGTLACAVGIGFVMQNGQDAQSRYGRTTPVEPIKVIALDAHTSVAETIEEPAVLSIKDITLTSADITTIPLPKRIDEPVLTSVGPRSSLQNPVAEFTAPRPSCEIKFDATTQAAAIVELNVVAPCLPQERVSIHHNGLTVSYVTSERGTLVVTMPAMAEDADFEVAFANGETVKTSLSVESLNLYDRVAVQWVGKEAVQLHAREFGADYGQDGHVWVGAARDLSVASSGEGGFVTRYGDQSLAASQMAEVYTFPKAMSKLNGLVDLTVEAEVTAFNCGRDLNAKTLQLEPSGNVTVREIELSLPGCEAKGDFLVLNNLLQDLKVAHK